MNDILEKCIFFFYCLLSTSFIVSSLNTTKCELPEKCRLEKVWHYSYFFENDFTFQDLGLICDINNDDEFEFKFKEPAKTNEKCIFDNKVQNRQLIIFRWMSSQSILFDKQFNFSNTIRYISYNNYTFVHIRLWGGKGFDVNLPNTNISFLKRLFHIKIELANSRLDFYIDDKQRIRSCEDLNMTRIRSIFQILTHKQITYSLRFRHVKYTENMCPLLFSNMTLDTIYFIGILDTFYKKNILSFSNTSSTGTHINTLKFDRVENLNLDLKILHPSIFHSLSEISITSRWLNSIDEGIFKYLPKLTFIDIDSVIFRKINHKQGIKWIRQINYNVDVNLSNVEAISEDNNYRAAVEILLNGVDNPVSRLPRTLPDEDFCIYVDFPFNQLVIVYNYEYYTRKKSEFEFTCTRLWLLQYAGKKVFLKIKRNRDNLKTLISELNETDSKKCKFEERIRLCNKSNYQIEDIWDQNDFFILSKKMLTVLKISLYPVSLFGLVTNFIVVLVILHKDNRDLFKEFKQYTYLWLNSIFCMMISVIEILSWMTECFYPFEVFCPETRKLVAFQFFKIIFRELFVTMFRFMCNFTYIAFALNRIGLIGREHGKLVTFMSELGVKKYIGVTLLISCSFSWVKYFTYQVNYFFSKEILSADDEYEFPIGFHLVGPFGQFIFTFNSISNLLIYFVFVLICSIIDICMVVQLRRVLDEKTKKSETNKTNKNKAENEEAVNKAIKMVVLNISIGIFCKLSANFLHILAIFIYYYSKYQTKIFVHSNFGYFFQMVSSSGFIFSIQAISDLLYSLSFSIQMFIYNWFDKKFRIAYDRLKDKAFSRIKNVFINKSNT